jgi:hypothetical protein
MVSDRFCALDYGVGLVGRLSAFVCGPNSPRTIVLGHSQSSLRDWSWSECRPRTDVLGYSQPSLRDWSRDPLMADSSSTKAYESGTLKKLILARLAE